MDSLEARITSRDLGLDRLNRVTTWIGLGALAAVGVFAVIAAATIPGKASSTQVATANASTPAAPSVTNRHHHDVGSGTISPASGPPVVVTGGSR